jgi:FKBP-type peptidyl-prolyl cis-trans isomerase (trigger factor)
MAAIYGVTLEEFLGKPVDKFREESKKDAEESYKTQMVLYATIYEEGFDKNIPDEKYHKWLADFSELLGVSKEQLVEQYSTETLKSTCLFDLFLDHIYQYRVEVEPSESTDSSSSSESTSSSVES